MVRKNITAIQQYFLEYSGEKSSGEIWMSKVVKNIWDPQKRIWGHRNSYAHESNRTIYQHKEEAITAVIWWEFAVGQNWLPATYSSLFTGKVQHIFNDDRITKSQLLIEIWNSRDRVRIKEGLGGWERNQICGNLYPKK